MDKFAAGKIRARRYRNPPIGEFFKEIDLSEKKSKGISKILRELSRNGSPLPEFETDEDRMYLITTIKIHDGFKYQSMVESISESMSQLEAMRMNVIMEHLKDNISINSSVAAKLLSVEIKTASRLLIKAEKPGLLDN